MRVQTLFQRCKSKGITVIILFLFVLPLNASETLDSLVKKALVGNHSYRRKQLDAKDAEAIILNAIGAATPEIRGEIAGAWLYDSVIDFDIPDQSIPVIQDIQTNITIPGLGNFPITVPVDTTFDLAGQTFSQDIGNQQLQMSLVFEQPIFTGGRVVTGILMSRLNKKVVFEEIESSRVDLVEKVMESFYQYLLVKKQVALSRKSYQAVEQYRDAAQKSFDAGVATELSLLEANTRLKELGARQLQAENGLADLLDYIRFICNDQSIMDIDGDLEPEGIDLDGADQVVRGLARRPDIKIIKHKKDLARLDIASGIGTMPLVPEVGMQVEFSYKNSNINFWNDPDLNIKIGIAGSIAIYDRMTTTSNLLKKIHAMQRVTIGEDELQKAAALEIRRYIREYNSKIELLDYWRDQLVKSEKALFEAGVKLDNGLITRTGFLAKEIELKDTEVRYYEAVYNHLISRLKILKATGSMGI
jgi:outer membrane protein